MGRIPPEMPASLSDHGGRGNLMLLWAHLAAKYLDSLDLAASAWLFVAQLQEAVHCSLSKGKNMRIYGNIW